MRLAIYITCSRNPGIFKEAKAKWAIYAYEEDGTTIYKKDGVSVAYNSTCKKATLIALRAALFRFTKAAVIKVFITDPFVRNMLKTNMPYRWSQHNWTKFRYGQEIKNVKLWMEVYMLLAKHAISYASVEELGKSKQIKEMEVK